MAYKFLCATCGLVALSAATAPWSSRAQETLPTIDIGHESAAPPAGEPKRSKNGGPATTVDGYVPLTTTAGAKTATPIVEIPQSIAIVTRKQLDDRNVQSVTQALEYTAGVIADDFGYQPRFEVFKLRGFDMTYTGIYRDGLRQPAAPFGIFRHEPYGLEAVAVIKGPSGALYGMGSPGGIIDLQSKRPTLTPLREVQLQIGEWSRYQGNIDLGGPIDAQGVYSYRLTGVFRDGKDWLPSGLDQRHYIAPAFAWRPDEQTSLTFFGEYMFNRTDASPFFYQNYSDGVLSRFYTSDPNFANYDQNQLRAGYEFVHEFDEHITFKQNARYVNVVADGRWADPNYFDLDAGIMNRQVGRVVDHLNTVNIDNQVQARFATGPIAHTAVAGLEWTYAQNNNKYGYRFNLVPDLLLFPAPSYGAVGIVSPAYSYNASQKQEQLAIYAQDQAKIGPVVLTASGRQDWVNTKTNTADANFFFDDPVIVTPSQEQQSDKAATWRVGGVYLAPLGFAPFANYATGFVPLLGTGPDGKAFKSQTSEQKEFGVKFQPPGWNALVAASWFDIRQSGILQSAAFNPNFQEQTGAVRSRGFEIEGVASVGPGFDLSIAYTALDLRFAGAWSEIRGNRVSGVPRETVKAWIGYTFQPGHALEGLGGGFGVRHASGTFGDDANSLAFKAGPTTYIDANLQYDLAKIAPSLAGLRVQVNGRNLADVYYRGCQTAFCFWGPRRTVIGSLIYRF
jgi:iron complex outermembrane receptor protein